MILIRSEFPRHLFFFSIQDEYQRSPRYQTRPLSMHTPTNPSHYQSKTSFSFFCFFQLTFNDHLDAESPIQRTHYQHHHYNNENIEWRRRRSPSPTSKSNLIKQKTKKFSFFFLQKTKQTETRSISMTRHPDPPEPVRGPSTDHLVTITMFSFEKAKSFHFSFRIETLDFEHHQNGRHVVVIYI